MISSVPLLTPNKITSIRIENKNVVLNVGKSLSLEVEVEPKNADKQEFSWESSDSNIVIVDEDGVISAISKGDAIITVEAGDCSASCNVTVKNPIKSIRIEEENVELNVGDSLALGVEIEPIDADEQEFSWNTSDSGIVTVDENGTIKAISGGDAIITVEAGECSAECSVSVKNEQKANTTNMNILAFFTDRLYVPLGYDQGLGIINNTGDDDVRFSSRDNNIVSFNGDKMEIHANKVGETIIVCECQGYIAECEIIVVDPETYSVGLDINDIDAELEVELIGTDTVRWRFRDIVPEGRVQSQFCLNYYLGENRSGNIISSHAQKGPYYYEESDVIELFGNRTISLDGYVIIDGQILELERQEFDLY